jgi:hypothetical protein
MVDTNTTFDDLLVELRRSRSLELETAVGDRRESVRRWDRASTSTDETLWAPVGVLASPGATKS